MDVKYNLNVPFLFFNHVYREKLNLGTIKAQIIILTDILTPDPFLENISIHGYHRRSITISVRAYTIIR